MGTPGAGDSFTPRWRPVGTSGGRTGSCPGAATSWLILIAVGFSLLTGEKAEQPQVGGPLSSSHRALDTVGDQGELRAQQLLQKHLLWIPFQGS